MTRISVVLSFRNEAGNIPELVARLAAVFAVARLEYELLFVNDASTDDSLARLLEARASNPRIKIINMSRRFGPAECLRAGLTAARGDAAIFMDADLQDPPEVIPRLLDEWRAGAAVVHTVRTRRHGESRLKTWLTRQAYRAIRAVSSVDLPVDAGDFKLLSRQAVTHLLRCRESDPYIRGLAVWIGFRQASVPYERAARHEGRTHFPLLSRNPWKTLVTGLTSLSFWPIYGVGALALAGVAASLGVAAAGLYLIALITFFWATLLGAIAIVGLYLVRVYKDVRQRPGYVVESTVGFGEVEDEADGGKAVRQWGNEAMRQ